MPRFSLSSRSMENRRGVEQRLIEISDLAIQITLVDFGHGSTSGLRTAETQRILYDSGKSLADGVIRKSKHQSGLALDFYAYVDGRASWEREHLAMVATAFLQAASHLGYAISWGGLWRQRGDGIYGWDMAHVELVDRA